MIVVRVVEGAGVKASLDVKNEFAAFSLLSAGCLNAVCYMQVWLDEDVELYDFAKVRPFILRKQVKVRS